MLSLGLSLSMVVVALFMGTFQYLNASALEMAKGFGAKRLAAKNAGPTKHVPAPPLLSPSQDFGGQTAAGKGPLVCETHAQQQVPELPPGGGAHAQKQMPELSPGVGAHAQKQVPELPPGVGAHAQKQVPELPPGIGAHAREANA